MNIKQVLSSLYDERSTVENIIHDKFGHVPSSKPNVVIGNGRSYLNLPEHPLSAYPGVRIGFYMPTYQLIGITPLPPREAKGINPRNDIVRVFAKEYSQHVYSSLHGHTEVKDVLLAHRTKALEPPLPGEHLPTKFFIESYIPWARTEAYGLVGMLHVAKQLGHTDIDNYLDIMVSGIANWLFLMGSLKLPNIRKKELWDMLHATTPIDMSYLLAMHKMELPIEEFRSDVRRPPNGISKEEIEYVFNKVNEEQKTRVRSNETT